MKRTKQDAPLCEMISDGTDIYTDIYIVMDGVKVAKRGHPGTPQARTWVSIEPGWRVVDNADLTEFIIEYNGARVH